MSLLMEKSVLKRALVSKNKTNESKRLIGFMENDGFYTKILRGVNDIFCYTNSGLIFIKHPFSQFFKRYFFAIHQNANPVNTPCYPHQTDNCT